MAVINCKRCGEPKEKHKNPTSNNSVDGAGKVWLGNICPDCTAGYMRERRNGVSDYPEVTCGGCGTTFKPKTFKSKECSAKCHMRVRRAKLKYNAPKEPITL